MLMGRVQQMGALRSSFTFFIWVPQTRALLSNAPPPKEGATKSFEVLQLL